VLDVVVVDIVVVDDVTGAAWVVVVSAVDELAVEAGPETSSSSEHATAMVARPMASTATLRGDHRATPDLWVSTPGA
jgi:hypothetical protein